MKKPLFSSKEKTLSVEELEKLEQEAISFAINSKKEKYSKEEIQELKKENRFFLPVLNINKSFHWEPKPLSERKHLTDEVAKEQCLSNCCNVPGLKSGCCNLDPDDLEHILGPVNEEWIRKAVKELSKRTGLKFTRHDFVIDFDEGRRIGYKFFNNHEVFQSPNSYPMLRFKVNGPRFCCTFLNVQTGMCTIYPFRPDMCKNYYCSYIKSNFLIRDVNHPSKWKDYSK